MHEPGYFQGLVYAGGESGISLKDVTVLGTVLNSGKTATGEGAPMVVERAGVVKAGAPGVEFEQSVTLDNPFTRLAKSVPKSTFYDEKTKRWNTDLSNIKQALLPALEIRVKGIWKSATDISDSVLVDSSLTAAAQQVATQLPSDENAPPPDSHFRLDLSRYLKSAERMRIVWLHN